MAKLTKPIKGVVKGEIYHREFAAGEECPPELEAAALELGALPKAKGNGKKGVGGDADGSEDADGAGAGAGAGTA